MTSANKSASASNMRANPDSLFTDPRVTAEHNHQKRASNCSPSLVFSKGQFGLDLPEEICFAEWHHHRRFSDKVWWKSGDILSVGHTLIGKTLWNYNSRGARVGSKWLMSRSSPTGWDHWQRLIRFLSVTTSSYSHQRLRAAFSSWHQQESFPAPADPDLWQGGMSEGQLGDEKATYNHYSKLLFSSSL